ncbi:MAG: hypothetical protein EXS09_00320 [Gemmataceae bacterium]|nr:hypothetical protein [Gemmataceae bacterium]
MTEDNGLRTRDFSMRHPEIAEIVRRDGRYAYEAYEFMFEALSHTQRLHGRAPVAGEEPGADHHVSGSEILKGVVSLARDEFGFLARTVFQQWGLRKTDDVGEVVFNLIEANLLSKTEMDHRSDFQDLFELDHALVDGFSISLDGEALRTRRGGR